MAVLLANKLSSRTLLGTQLMQLVSDIYRDDPVSHFTCHRDWCNGGMVSALCHLNVVLCYRLSSYFLTRMKDLLLRSKFRTHLSGFGIPADNSGGMRSRSAVLCGQGPRL